MIRGGVRDDKGWWCENFERLDNEYNIKYA